MALDHAVNPLSSSAELTKAEAVGALVRIVRDDAAHRQRILFALETVTVSHRGRPSYRSEPVLTARTVLWAFNPKCAVRSIASIEGTAAALLAASVATGYTLGSNSLTRVLISAAVGGAVAAASPPPASGNRTLGPGRSSPNRRAGPAPSRSSSSQCSSGK
ncbi:hypothetical protein [Streptomyces roseochromogenus]|uniref:Uncharacterized protein n=1 Tax=Streptomyces roseochromogenus subsp. oscitans DS 12.976 TaxID=1352936 RepID=V6KXC4_STRRC|nr:hypothetical protein [Streptomyces roseochromogenus]EST36772.1 hypothetical protein M878_00585 [Streptomyces roseochromogenus subsp. oscitans DS 12.976]